MIGQLLDGRYKIVRALSSGTFGETYRAEDRKRPGNPTCVFAYNNRGVARSDLRDKQVAIADCSKAIELKPDDAGAYAKRSVARY